MKEIDINDYNYDLPAERIAQYPVNERDKSQLLIFKDGIIKKNTFKNIDEYLPTDSLLVFNNTRVIRARILFKKQSGAAIEILCLEPALPAEYALSFGSVKPVEWKCIVGNLKKWKKEILMTPFTIKGREYTLNAERLVSHGEISLIKFTWNSEDITFGEVIEAAGHVPLPPYIDRSDETADAERYQTVYSKINGSVAAPTAGLHFTDNVLKSIRSRGIKSAELTLHVGAGTFQPVKVNNIYRHEMHCEHFSINATTIELLLQYAGRIIPVGTTSVRTLESIYWMGVKLIQKPADSIHEFSLLQWEPYELNATYSVEESLKAILNFLKDRNSDLLQAETSIIIIPGYNFRLTSGMVTNFHQPRSTLLLLISAWTGSRWKEIYSYALENGFRFLSYGDSSLLLK
jgi:S-adenosylmethionine:tRNA ribosyltransferase-isomerase